MWYNQFWGQIPLDVGNLSKTKLAEYENNLEFLNTFCDYFNTALNKYKWEGLPDTCDERMIETSMLLAGKASFVEYKGSLINLVPNISGGFTLYQYAPRYWGFGWNGFSLEFQNIVKGAEELPLVGQSIANVERAIPIGVVGFDNAKEYPYVNLIIMQAKRLADMMRTMDVIVKGLKHPVIFAGEDKTINAFKEMEKQLDKNLFSIFKVKNFSLDDVKQYDTKVDPATLTALREHYMWIDGELKTKLGINANENPDKRERLVVDEVNINNEIIEENTDKRLLYRKEFAKRVNEVFGTNISVDVRNKEFGVNPTMQDFNDSEGGEDDVDE